MPQVQRSFIMPWLLKWILNTKMRVGESQWEGMGVADAAKAEVAIEPDSETLYDIMLFSQRRNDKLSHYLADNWCSAKIGSHLCPIPLHSSDEVQSTCSLNSGIPLLNKFLLSICSFTRTVPCYGDGDNGVYIDAFTKHGVQQTLLCPKDLACPLLPTVHSSWKISYILVASTMLYALMTSSLFQISFLSSRFIYISNDN